MTVISSGCASRLLAVGNWAQNPDLRLDNKSLHATNVKIGCYRSNRVGTLDSRSYKVCAGLASDLEAYGATIVDDANATDHAVDYTVQYVDLQKVESNASFWSFAASSATGWIVPFVWTYQSAAEFRIIDSRGVLIDRVPMTIAKISVFGWSSVVSFFDKSEAEQKKFISRQVYLAARNRLASRVRANRWAQP